MLFIVRLGGRCESGLGWRSLFYSGSSFQRLHFAASGRFLKKTWPFSASTVAWLDGDGLLLHSLLPVSFVGDQYDPGFLPKV